MLLDTNAFLWAANDPVKLSRAATALLALDEEAVLSIASVWEIAIKVGLGKLDFPIAAMDSEIEVQKLALLPISVDHALRAGALPRHHKDPFDRMLAAQAAAENLPIVSPDPIFERYGIRTIW